MSITTINPANEKEIKIYNEMSQKEVEQAVLSSHRAYLDWKEWSLSKRAECFKKAAEILRKNTDSYAKLMAEEIGKPLAQGEAEIEKCAWVCEYYAEHAEGFLGRQYIETEASKSYVSFEPLGVVLAIMPWNFPFWQVFRFAVPTLIAGNGVLLKHAPNTFGCGVAIEEIFHTAGFPSHLFKNLIINHAQTAEVIRHKQVVGVTLTGSNKAGRVVAAEAGKALKKTVLELGGSDPYIVLADADLDLAVDKSLTARMLNTGQVCISAKRLIIIKDVIQAFQEKVIEKLKSFKMGDPFDLEVNLGPMAREDLRDNLHQQVQLSIKQGAKLIQGGEVPEGKGYFYPPTILTNVKKGMPAFDEEVFGPVVVLIEAKDEEEAIALANDSDYGLGAAVFTEDVAKGEVIAEKELQAGCCFVNDFVKSDPRLPFGGIKNSGFGREIGSIGIKEFVNAKTVYIS